MSMFLAFFLAAIVSHSPATGSPVDMTSQVAANVRLLTTYSPHISPQIKRRSAGTCADPSLARVFVEAYSPSNKAHFVDVIENFVRSDTESIAPGDWQIQIPAVFSAWKSPQPFTFPLYVLANPTTEDVIFLTSTTGSPPVVSGFQFVNIVGYVYATQVCGSVPLLVAFNEAAGDHWYTTDSTAQSSLIGEDSGWSDPGIAAFVLPSGRCVPSAFPADD